MGAVNKPPLPPADLDLIERLLRFANHPPFTEQQQVYDLFLSHPFVVRVNGEPYLAPIPEGEGVGPFLNDQVHVCDLLRALASGDTHGVEKVQKEVGGKLGEKLKAFLRVEWKKGSLQLRGEPVLDGIEVCFYYPLALLFHHGLERRVKTCQAHLKDIKRECGNFYLATRERRSGCSPKHGEIISDQKNLKRVKKHYNEYGRPTAKKKRRARKRQ